MMALCRTPGEQGESPGTSFRPRAEELPTRQKHEEKQRMRPGRAGRCRVGGEHGGDEAKKAPRSQSKALGSPGPSN